MQLGKKSIVIVYALISLGIISTAQAAKKSVYAITNHSNSTIAAFKIIDNELEYQTETNLHFGSGAVGLAIDPDSWTIFTSYDGSNNIGIINAKTMEPEEDPVVVAPWELAGIVWDNTVDRLYGMRREGSTSSDNIVIYEWDPVSKELVQDGNTIKLPSFPNNGLGIALDEDDGLLYATDNTNTVYVYNTTDWSFVDSFDVTVDSNDRKCVAIAVYNDGQGSSWVYTGGYSHTDEPLPDHTYLVRTNTSSPYTSNEVDVGEEVLGTTVDAEMGLVYITSQYQDIRVYDNNLALQYTDGNDVDGYPADIFLVPGVAYKDPDFILVKDNNDPNNGCVEPFDDADENYLIYDICWDANGFADTNVVIKDILPEVLDYNSSTPAGDYNSTYHTVTWDLNDIGANDSNCFTLTTKVTTGANPGGTITNICEIEGDNYFASASETTCIACWGGEIIYVDDDNDGGNGFSWETAFNDLQVALDTARSADCYTSIWVAAGTYKPVNDVNVTDYEDYSFELVDNVGLFGHFVGDENDISDRDFNDPNNETILDGQIGQSTSDAVEYVVKAEDINDSMIDGFTIKGSNNGAGIYLYYDSNAVVINCKLQGNNDYGIYVQGNSSADISNCTFLENGIAIRALGGTTSTVTNCDFEQNNTGIRGYGTMTIKDCSIKETLNDALYCSDTDLTLEDCNITDTGNDDWAISCDESDVTFRRCVISDNDGPGLYLGDCSSVNVDKCVISYNGGGIVLYEYEPYAVNITNNWIHNNYGSGIYLFEPYCTYLIRNNTICDNSTGIKLDYGIEPNIINCILWGNSDDLVDCNATYSCISNCEDAGGVGNICGDANDPCFVDADSNDFHLLPTSPCIDIGDPNGSYTGETDIDGDDRVIDIFGKGDGNVDVDMGADEFECYAGMPDYDQWEEVGKPECWCYPRQCHGDADGQATGNPLAGYEYVGTPDTDIMSVGWQVKDPPHGSGILGLEFNGVPVACADFGHDKTGNPLAGYERVGTTDIDIMAEYWLVKEPPEGSGTPADCLPGNMEP